MVFRRTFHVVLFLPAVGASLFACCSPAAEPKQDVVHAPVRDQQGLMNRLFGEECREDKEALAKIEVSLAEERQIGETAVRAYLEHLRCQRIRVLAHGKNVDYLRGLVETIRPLTGDSERYPRIHVYLVQSPRCEVRSFPGGTLVFFRGLLQCAQSEAAVVGIVGHELSHLDRGHHLWRLRRVKLAQRTLLEGTGGPSPDRLLTARTILMRIWTRPFRPEEEIEADRDGAAWAYAAGYDPREMARMCLRPRGGRTNRPVPLTPFMQTHPPPEVRCQAIMQQYERLRQEEPNGKLYIGKENLRHRVTRAQREYKE